MEATLQKIFNTVSFDAITAEKLQELTVTYPYFAPLHYFLALKSKAAKTSASGGYAGKAALYFNNPLWFREQLKGWKSATRGMTVEEDDFLGENPEQELEITDSTPPLAVKFSGEAFVGEKAAGQHQAEVQKEELPIFQAYHTVDYFASLGIKISADMLQNDQLGRQLRSFTEWLRTMKKIPAAAGTKPEEIPSDPRIIRFAETSLREGEVLTEAMAQVLLKQGKRQAALDLYEKLSLLNPHKSAYFAALIEKLKAV